MRLGQFLFEIHRITVQLTKECMHCILICKLSGMHELDAQVKFVGACFLFIYCLHLNIVTNYNYTNINAFVNHRMQNRGRQNFSNVVSYFYFLFLRNLSKFKDIISDYHVQQ